MRKVFERQGLHVLAFVSIGAALFWASFALGVATRRAWGLSAFEWVVASWLSAGLMQAWIWFFWRTELHLRWITRAMGHRGFLVFGVGFVALACARFLPILPISIATARTSPVPRPLAIVLLAVTAPPILWTYWSFARYFGARRAMGADHFDPAYRGRGLETRGIFRFVRNPAYAVGLLLVYHAGLIWESALALVVAAGHHAFVWVAYLCTERPDLREIYGPRRPG